MRHQNRLTTDRNISWFYPMPMGSVNTNEASHYSEENHDQQSVKTNTDCSVNLGFKESQINLQKPTENPDGTTAKGGLKSRNGDIATINNDRTTRDGLEIPRKSSSYDDNVFVKTILAIFGNGSSNSENNPEKSRENGEPQLKKASRNSSRASKQEHDDEIPSRKSTSCGQGIRLSSLNVPAYQSDKKIDSRIRTSTTSSSSTSQSSNRSNLAIPASLYTNPNVLKVPASLSGNRSKSCSDLDPRRSVVNSRSTTKNALEVQKNPKQNSNERKKKSAKTVSIAVNNNQRGVSSGGNSSLKGEDTTTNVSAGSGQGYRVTNNGLKVRRPGLVTTECNEKQSIHNLKEQRQENNNNPSAYLEAGRITAIELPTARKGFMGDIGFTFGGAVREETDRDDDWESLPILVENVTRGSIAEKAGVEIGDEIVKINGVSVRNAARSVAVALIRNSQKKILILVRKGTGGKRREARTFSGDQLEEFRDVFSIYDRSNKGKIHVNDVSNACRILGYNETALDLDNAIYAARVATGEPDSDKVRYDTFLETVKEFRKFQNAEEDAKYAFAVFDPDNKGRFNIRLLRDAFLASTKRMTPLEMAEIFRMADPDRDERVKEKEFMSLLYPYIEM